ncbi:MAG: nitrate reductase [Hyphomicrobiaceae bacterium]|nr:nitrate reductase [Hyphomicrobiaceae bacterium]
MAAFVNPIRPRGGATYSEALSRIRAWTRAHGPTREATISVTELACPEPGCPPRETVILVMRPEAPTWKLRVHKPMPDVNETDVIAALRAAETIDSSQTQSTGTP